MICVNLFGKSAYDNPMLVSEIFHGLRGKGFEVELTGSIHEDDDQLRAFACQAFRLRQLAKKHTQVVLCDSPLLLSVVYQKLCVESSCFTPLVKDEFEKYQNLNYFIPSKNMMDGMIKRVLEPYGYKILPIGKIKDDVLEEIERRMCSG